MLSLSKNRFLVRFFGGAIGITLLGSAVIGSAASIAVPVRPAEQALLIIKETFEQGNERLRAIFPQAIRATRPDRNNVLWANIKITCEMLPQGYGALQLYGGGGKHSLELIGMGMSLPYQVSSGQSISVPCKRGQCVYDVWIDGRKVENQLIINAN